MNSNPRSTELMASAFASGCVLHVLFYRRGEWDLLVPRIVQAYAALPAVVLGTTRLAESRGLLDGIALGTASVLLLELAHIMGIFSSILVYRIIFHRLNRFSGPFRARISNFYPTYLRAKNLRLYEEVERLHKKHGDFVRIGPTELSIIDPKAVDAIYSARSPCTKGPFYNLLHPRISLHMTRDRKEHQVRRKVWDRAFSSKALRDYEPRVTEYTSQLLDRLSELQGRAVNASDWFNFYSFDVMGDLAFGKSFNMLRGGVKHYFMNALHESMTLNGYLSHIPWIYPLVKMIPPVNAENTKFWTWCETQVEERSKLKPDKPDVFSWILDEYERNPKTKQAKLNLDAEAHLIAVAGRQIIKLRSEVDEYFGQRDHADPASLANLAHLNAVIDEALRLHPAVPSGLQRVTPPEGLMIGDTKVPGNTTVQVPLHTIQRGRYSCVGKQLGLMEVRYVVAHVIRAFDFGLASGQTKEDFHNSKRDTFTLTIPRLDMVFVPRLTQ
ncbi:hypothetical protein F66182_3371 [Fusarium sp. NRRL 66182]|nr:hypothetical protein F66182_3371 [Fusarium sp. NRRL 66182]